MEVDEETVCLLTGQRAKMARLVRGCPITRSQQEGTEEPDRDPQQKGQLDTTEGKDIADYDLDIYYEG